jgi:hypothetical protein
VRAGLAREGARQAARPAALRGADTQFEAVADRSLREAALALGVSRSVVHRWRLSQTLETAHETVTISSGIPAVGA